MGETRQWVREARQDNIGFFWFFWGGHWKDQGISMSEV